MTYTIEILEEKKNPLIDRVEIKFRVDHFAAGTPNRLDVKKKIATMKKSNKNLTIVRELKTHFGESYAIGKVNIYDNAKELQYFEPFHIQVRNLDKEKRTEIYKLKKRKEPYKHLFEYD
ncbi:MAG: 30S ribosomal protein S24e [Candidatus Hodarchaeota archaeon]